jgi:hypothetical protein
MVGATLILFEAYARDPADFQLSADLKLEWLPRDDDDDEDNFLAAR